MDTFSFDVVAIAQPLPPANWGMDTRDLPTREVVIRDGQPVWRVCTRDLCVEDRSGQRAASMFEALCASRGIQLPTGDAPPARGPSEVDEPGV